MGAVKVGCQFEFETLCENFFLQNGKTIPDAECVPSLFASLESRIVGHNLRRPGPGIPVLSPQSTSSTRRPSSSSRVAWRGSIEQGDTTHSINTLATRS